MKQPEKRHSFRVSHIPPEISPVVTRAAETIGVIPGNDKQDPMKLLRKIRLRQPELADLLDEYAFCHFRWSYERSYEEGGRAEVELRKERDTLLQKVERMLSGAPAEQPPPPTEPKRHRSLKAWLEEKALQLLERRLGALANRQPPLGDKQDSKKRDPS